VSFRSLLEKKNVALDYYVSFNSFKMFLYNCDLVVDWLVDLCSNSQVHYSSTVMDTSIPALTMLIPL